MAGTVVDSLQGVYKEIYGQLVNAVPECAELLKLIKYDQGNRIGDSFHEPVILTNEHGYTYMGTAGDSTTLETPVTTTSKDAVVSAYSYCMASSLSLAAISRAQASGPQAFKSAVSVIMGSALESSKKRLNISCYYGQKGIGDVPDTAATVETTATTATLVFSAASWAPGIWAGAEGALLQFYDLDDDALISSGADAVFAVTSVANSTRTVVVTGTSTGIDALDVAVQAGGVRAYFKGSKTNDMPGMVKVLENTGTIFNIDASIYGLWRAQTRNVAGQLTMDEVLEGVADLVGRGLTQDVILLVNPATWADLHAEQMAARVYDGSYSSSKATSGSEAIQYYGPTGKVTVKGDPCIKGGDAFLIVPEHWKRIGSAEHDSNLPTQDQNPFFADATTASVGFRLFSDQAIYCRKPAQQLYFYGIVNGA